MTTSLYDAGVKAPHGRVPPLPPVTPDIPAVSPPVVETAPAPVIVETVTAETDQMAELDLTRTRAVLSEWQERHQNLAAEVEEQMGALGGIEGELLRARRKIVAGEAKASATAPILARKAETEAALAELRARLALVADEMAEAQKSYAAAAQRRGAVNLRAEADALKAEAAASDALLSSLMEPLVAAANARTELEARGRELARRIRQHDEDPAQPAKAGAFDPACTFLRWNKNIPATSLPRKFRWPGEG